MAESGNELSGQLFAPVDRALDRVDGQYLVCTWSQLFFARSQLFSVCRTVWPGAVPGKLLALPVITPECIATLITRTGVECRGAEDA